MLPCISSGVPTLWQSPWTQVLFQVVKELRGAGWHFTQLFWVPFSPCATCSSVVAWHSEHRWLP